MNMLYCIGLWLFVKYTNEPQANMCLLIMFLKFDNYYIFLTSNRSPFIDDVNTIVWIYPYVSGMVIGVEEG